MRALDLPIYLRKKMAPKVGENFFGPSPSVFIGHYGYPNVFAGPLGALEERQEIDDPSQWIKKDYAEIIELRSLMIRSKQAQNIFSADRFTHDMQDISLATNSPDIEVGFKKKPLLKFSVSQYTQPMGPTGMIDKFKVVENPKIPNFVEAVVTDDLKANDSAVSLYSKGIDVYKITTILSAGTLGIKKKLVPTRWSITATDDIIAKNLIKDIREFRQIDDILVFESQHLDNHFLIFLMPGSWEFENFEA
jgi:DNA repair protein NreA